MQDFITIEYLCGFKLRISLGKIVGILFLKKYTTEVTIFIGKVFLEFRVERNCYRFNQLELWLIYLLYNFRFYCICGCYPNFTQIY